MRKRILCLTLVCLLVAVCVVFSSCSLDGVFEEPCAHTFSDEWTSDDTNHWHAATCKHTNEKSDVAAHVWDDGVVTAEPTDLVGGVMTYTCTVCQKTKTESIAALGHTHTFADTLSYDENGHYYAASCEHSDERKDFSPHETTAAVTPPTCTEEGFTTYTCDCGYSYTADTVPVLEHDWQIVGVGSDGKHNVVCAYDPTHTATVDCTYDSVATPPTCTEDGYTTHTCECGHSYVDTPVDAIDHDWQIAGEGTNGKHGMVCANDPTHTATVDCTYDAVVTPPTCTEDGYTTHTCECGYSYVDTPVDAIDHDWQIAGEGTNGKHGLVCANDPTHTDEENCIYDSVVTPPTCTEDGYTTHTCECGYSYTDAILPALKHDWQIVGAGSDGKHNVVCANDPTHTATVDCTYETTVTPPTCTEAGYTTYTCECGYSYTGNTVAAIEHAYGEWTPVGEGQHERVCANDPKHVQTVDCEYSESVTEPGCMTGGYTTYTCICGDSYTGDETEPKGHSYKTEWSTNDAYHWHDATCEHSTARSEYEGHSYTEFVSTTAPSCDTDGYTTYRCECGKTENRDTVPALGHKYGEFVEKDRILFDESLCQYAVTYATVCDVCGDPQQKVEYTENHNFYYEKEKGDSCAVIGENAICKPTCQSTGIQHKHCANPDCRYNADCIEVIHYEDPEAHAWDGGVQSGSVITYTCTLCSKTKNTAVVTDGSTADISGGQVDEVAIGQTTINMNEAMKDTLTKDKTDPVSITAGVTEDEDTKRQLLEQYGFTLEDIGNQPIYSFTVTGASEEDFGNGGMATITIPYTLGEGDDRNNIIVFYISNGKLEAIEADYWEENGQGYATFRTSHFSDYVPTSVKPEELCELFGKHSDDVHVVLATCTTDGYTVCLRCNQIIETTPALGHKWISEVASVTTCEENGVIKYTCAECSSSFDTIIPATGHYHVLSDYSTATCHSEGRSVYGCIYCDDEYVVTELQLSHQYVGKTVAPTCDTRGYTQRTCTLCADVRTTYVPALGHTFSAEFERAEEGHYHVCTVCGGRDDVQAHTPGEEATEEHAQLCTVCEYVVAPQLTHRHKNMTHYLANDPTCTNSGNKEYFVCACGKWFLDEAGEQLVTDHTSVVLVAFGHTHEEIPYVAPTCTDAGNTAGIKCSACGVLLKGNIRIAPQGHDYAQTVVRPTCDVGGYTEFTCSCGDTYRGNETAPLGHRYNIEVLAPTCTDEGYTTYTCQKCEHSYVDDATAALGHSYSAAWKTDGEKHWHECTRCNAKDDEQAHVKDYESATEDHGVSCTVCGFVIEQIKDHTHSVKTAYDAQAPECERSGKRAYFVCSCGDWFFDSDCTQPIPDRAMVVIPAIGHSLVRVDQVDSTCQSAGTTAGYYCENCSFNAGCTVIEPVAHKFVELKRDDNAHWYKCATCNEISDYEEHKLAQNVVAPGCTTPGYTEFSCDCGYEYVADNKPAAGHSFGEWACNYDGTHTRVCALDPRHQQTELCEYDSVVVEATCETMGYTVRTCDCGYSKKDSYVPAKGHSYGEWIFVGEGKHAHTCANDPSHVDIASCIYVSVITSPTCTEQGYTTYTCASCEHSYVDDETDALGHSYEAVVTAPTCTEGGFTTYTCTACGDSYVGDETDALGHSYEAVVTAPTCTEQGYTTYTCTVCGDSYVGDETDALGHSYEAVVTAPTCTEGGFTTYTCTACGHSYVGDETDALGHSYEAVVTAPTCTEGGFTTYTCTVCGDIYVDDETDALGHDYEAEVTAPTCTEQGYTTYTCKACGYNYVDDYTDVIDHSYNAVVTAPNCTEQGYTTYTCTVCGDSYVGDYTDALGHDYEAEVTAPTCTEQGYTTYTCKVCGYNYVDDYTDVIDHSYNAVVTAPSCTEQGYTTYTCTVCGDSYVGDYVAANGHDFSNGFCSNCGTADDTYYATNSIVLEVVYDEQSGRTTLVIVARNADLAGIRLTIRSGAIKTAEITCHENAAFYNDGERVSYVFSGGENTVGDISLLTVSFDGNPEDLELDIIEIYRFTGDGNLEIPEYSVTKIY